jgi:protein TonB
MIDLLPAAPVIPKVEAAPGPQAPDSFQQSDLEHAPPTPERAAELPPLPRQDAAVTIPEPTRVPQVADEQAREETKKPSEHRAAASRSAAPQTFEARRHAAASAKAAGAAATPAAVASWKSELMAQLNRYKRYPPGAGRDGTSLVAFNVNRSGAVTAARLARSSGNSKLDQEAVSLPRRASPLPRPPDGIATASIALTVPIHFER